MLGTDKEPSLYAPHCQDDELNWSAFKLGTQYSLEGDRQSSSPSTPICEMGPVMASSALVTFGGMSDSTIETKVRLSDQKCCQF